MNNPLRYTDPTGHRACGDEEAVDCDTGLLNNPSQNVNKGCGGPNKPCIGKTNDKEKKKSDKNLGPDYYIGSVFIPFFPEFPIPGFEISVVRDKYGNWYVTPGLGVSLGPSISGGGGWLLKQNNNHEYVAEGFLQGHSFNVSGGYGIGVGVNNVNPLYVQTDNKGSSIEDISIEALGTSPGVSAVVNLPNLVPIISRQI